MGRVVPHYTAVTPASLPHREPPCRGDGPRRGATLSTLESKLTRSSKKMPLPNICSRLLSRVSKNRPALELGACALLILATRIEPRLRHACTERDTNRPRESRLAVAGVTDPEWRTGLVPTSPAVIVQLPPRGMPGFSGITHARVVSLHEPKKPNH